VHHSERRVTYSQGEQSVEEASDSAGTARESARCSRFGCGITTWYCAPKYPATQETFNTREDATYGVGTKDRRA